MSLFKINTSASSEVSAAMAIHDEFIYFIEIDENGKPQRKITVPLADGCIVNGQIKNFSLLENAFSEIRRSIGKIHTPVCIGLPEGETIIRFPTFPDMNLEDIRGSLDLNFSEYFPYPREEAVFDLVKIKTPDDSHKSNITILAASARVQTVEHILAAAHNVGIPVGPVEPLSFAMIRAIPDAYQGLCIVADAHNIVAIWNGDGLYFRTADNQRGTQDIFNTIRYIETQYRGVNVDKIILLGADFEVVSNTDNEDGPQIIADRDEYYASRGLAMRDTPGFQALDMRPQEFIEIEHRRYAFNINRMILWSLILMLVIFSAGTVSFTLLCLQNIDDRMFLLRANIQELTPQRIALQRENSALEQQNAEKENVLRFLQDDIPILEILNELESSAGAGQGVKFDNADFLRRSEGSFIVTLSGKADDEKALLSTLRILDGSRRFNEIKLPVSQQDESGRVSFTLILELGGGPNEG